jgi:thiol-disulfide isomerase/thioredoxin
MRRLLIVLAGLTGLCGPAGAVEAGQPAPALSVTETGGRPFDLAALRGHVVAVHYWATWCVPCREEMPLLDALYRRYHGQGLDVIALSADRPRDRAEVAKAMAAFAFPAAMLRDAAANGFGPATELPVTFLVDRAGIVRARLQPDRMPVTEQSLSAAILPLLEQKP